MSGWNDARSVSVDPELRAVLREAHARGGEGPRDGSTCICGLAGPPHPACAAALALAQTCARLGRTIEAMGNYGMALFDVEAPAIEAYVQAHGWHCGERDEECSHWEHDDGQTRWTLTIGHAAGSARPVDHLRDALETLERVEGRPRYAILADLLPDRA
jgi:hypothetical protein